MNKEFPWLDKPVEKWSYRELERECARFGFSTFDIDKYLNAAYDNREADPDEFSRRKAVFEYVLSWDPYNRLGLQLYWEYDLKQFKKGGYLHKKRFRGRCGRWIHALLCVIYYRTVDLFH